MASQTLFPVCILTHRVWARPLSTFLPPHTWRMTPVAWILHLPWTEAFSRDFAAPPTRRPEVFSAADREPALGLAAAQWRAYSGPQQAFTAPGASWRWPSGEAPPGAGLCPEQPSGRGGQQRAPSAPGPFLQEDEPSGQSQGPVLLSSHQHLVSPPLLTLPPGQTDLATHLSPPLSLRSGRKIPLAPRSEDDQEAIGHNSLSGGRAQQQTPLFSFPTPSLPPGRVGRGLQGPGPRRAHPSR